MTVPLYRFYCEVCGETIQRIVKIDQRDKQECEECQVPMGRKIDAPGMVWAPTSTSGGHRV